MKVPERIAEIREKQKAIHMQIQDGVSFAKFRELMQENEKLEKQISDIREYDQFEAGARDIEALCNGMQGIENFPKKTIASYLRFFAARTVRILYPDLPNEKVVEITDTL